MGKDKSGGGFGFGLKMPKFHGTNFGGSGKAKGGIDGPDLDVDGKAKLDIGGGVDVDAPDAKAKVELPDADVKAGFGGSLPDADVNLKGPDADLNLPKGGVSGDVDVKGPDVGGGIGGGIGFGIGGRKGSHSDSDDDDDKKKKKKDKSGGGFGFGLKMPKFHGPNFGGSGKAKGGIDGPDLDVDGKAKLDIEVALM